MNPIGILTRPHLWPTWAEIALDEQTNARAARAEEMTIVEQRPGKEGLADALLRELKASLVCIAAVSHSFDALYGVLADMVVDRQLRRTWRENETPPHRKVFETLKRAIDVDPQTQARRSAELKWLFRARNPAVHFREATEEPVPHPSGTNTSPINLTYSWENAVRAVDLLLDTLRKLPGRLQACL